MAVSISSLTTGSDEDGGSASTTASVSPSANKLQLLTVSTRTGITANPNTPTITGNGLTWVAVNSILFDSSGSTRRKLFVFRAMGASPSAGTISIDFGGQAQTNTCWALEEFTGMDTSGTNGSGAIVQSATNVDETGTATSLTVTLAAFGSTNNATWGAFGSGLGSDGTKTAGTGFTKISDINSSTAVSPGTEFRNDNDTSVDFTWSAISSHGGVAIEIKAAASGAVTQQANAYMTAMRGFWGST